MGWDVPIKSHGNTGVSHITLSSGFSAWVSVHLFEISTGMPSRHLNREHV